MSPCQSEPTQDATGNSPGRAAVALVFPVVGLVKSVNPNTPQPPATDLTYTIAFTNAGGTTAQSLVISDPVPTNTDFKVGSVTNSLGTTGLTIAVAYSNNGGSHYACTRLSA